jgi:Ferritin-like domain
VVNPAPAGADSTRRSLLKRSTAAAVTAGGLSGALAACGGSSKRPDVRSIPTAARDADVTILNGLLDLSERTIAAYTACVPLFSGHLKAAGKQFLNQDLAHAGELYRLIKQADGEPNKPRASYDLGKPRGIPDLVRLLHQLEGEMITHYLHALPSLSPGSVRAAVASMMANDAQHVVVLRIALHLPPIPGPLVTGAD